MFVKPTLRKSLLAKMLGELLDTRVMIKQAMKGWKNDKVRLQPEERSRCSLDLMFPAFPTELESDAQLAPARSQAARGTSTAFCNLAFAPSD